MSLDWQRDGLCRQVDPELFFPHKNGTAAPARKICNACDVREQCLEWALETDATDGVAGGLTHRERRRIRNQRGLPPVYAADRDARIERARDLAESGVTADVIAVTLGVSERTVYRWVTDAREVVAA